MLVKRMLLIVNQVKNAKKNEGFNVLSGKIEDMFEAGVIDPTKVSRTALENAASVCIITSHNRMYDS